MSESEDVTNIPSHKNDEGIVKIISDEPVLKGALGFNRYSRLLAHIIVNSTPRFSVGIFGNWGMGKTTLMMMIKEELKKMIRSYRCGLTPGDMKEKKNLAVIPFLRQIRITLTMSLEERKKREDGKHSRMLSNAPLLPL